MRPPRGLCAEESAAWARLAATVTPLEPPASVKNGEAPGPARSPAPAPAPVAASRPLSLRQSATTDRPSRPGRPDAGLDSHWDRRLRAGGVEPDFTLDLHGLTLTGAHARLETGLGQARAMGARLVLLIAGKPRPAEAADRGVQRGAIRAKMLDWLAAGPHAGAVAAVRPAHRRHGGEGALYLVLKRQPLRR